jgi:hypothetical protein
MTKEESSQMTDLKSVSEPVLAWRWWFIKLPYLT